MGEREGGDPAPPALPDGLLAAPRRRYLLYYLCRHGEDARVSLPVIADRVTEWETGAPAEERLDERLRVYMSLYHDHVPPLADGGLVGYDQEADAVELATDADALRAYLRRTAPVDLPAPGDLELEQRESKSKSKSKSESGSGSGAADPDCEGRGRG